MTTSARADPLRVYGQINPECMTNFDNWSTTGDISAVQATHSNVLVIRSVLQRKYGVSEGPVPRVLPRSQRKSRSGVLAHAGAGQGVDAVLFDDSYPPPN